MVLKKIMNLVLEKLNSLRNNYEKYQKTSEKC
jgi:hypothetical protein